MKTDHLRAVIVKVTQGDKVVINQAFGGSMTGVPATTAMHFRNGAVAFAYLATLLMQFVDEHKVSSTTPSTAGCRRCREANKVTLKMLANQTSGLSRLRDRPGLDGGLQRRSVPHLHLRGTAQVRFPPAGPVRPGDELELRAHQLHDPRRRSCPRSAKKPLDTLLRRRCSSRWA